ncbi:hypothetical protein [Marinifilum sp.]|uniref:hypothetical protein n=1 Tax=Marinifilum sp. TaxID=2033137 RepID=UPI003BAC94C8
MKKILYMASALALMFTACDPMEDVYEEVDKAYADEYEEQLFFSDKTLIEDGYELIEADYALSSDQGVKDYKNFSKYAPVADFLPEILNNKLFYGEPGLEYTVSYNFYIPSSYDRDMDPEAHKLTNNDYDLLGDGEDEPGEYGSFNKNMPIDEYLLAFMDRRFPIAKVGDYKLLNYKFYGTGDRYVEYEYNGTVWVNSDKDYGYDEDTAYEMTSDDYDSFGEDWGDPGKFDNFTSSIKVDDYLPDFLIAKYPDAVVGDKKEIKYVYYGLHRNLYVGYTLEETGWRKSVNVEFDWATGEYVLKTLSQTITQSSLVAYKDRTWVFVPPVKLVVSEKAATETYTLVNADYELVGDGKYHNFYTKDMSEEEIVAAILPKITKILKANFELAVGDVYEITYAYYNGTGGSDAITLEVVEDI